MRAKILVLNQYFPPDASATAYLLGDLTGGLAEEHDVFVVAGRASYSPEAGGSVPSGPVVHRVQSTSFSRSSMAGRIVNYATFFCGAAVKAFRSPRPDVVIAFTDPPLIGIAGALTAMRHRSRFIYACMDLYPDVAVALGWADHPVLVRAWRVLNRLLRQRADRIVVVGRDMAERLIGEGVPPEKVTFIPNWATARQEREVPFPGLRARHGWNDRLVVMHAGNVGLAQGLGTVVAAAELLREREDIRLVFLGDGAARADLEQRAATLNLRNIEFLPQRSKDAAQDLIAEADVHLISLAPGLAGAAVPSKVYGVLAQGRPFLAAVEPNSEVDRIAEESGAGCVVPPGDASALATEIAAFADGARDRVEMGLRARAEFDAKYRSELAVDRYVKLVNKVLQADGAPDRP